uniref:Uncharacterized protein n=1 Tax=Brassica oleracea var. oleracea TaxID=109376 RepID=A0A0D3CP99_BRAOL
MVHCVSRFELKLENAATAHVCAATPKEASLKHRDHGFRGVDDECKANTRRYVRGDEILKVNANTEYLRRFLHGSSDKELFKKNVLVVTYEDVRPYIERVVNGEPTNLISGEPIIHFFQRAGPENSEA